MLNLFISNADMENDNYIKIAPFVGEKYEYGFKLNVNDEIMLGDTNNLGYKILFLNERIYVDSEDLNYSFINDMFEDYFQSPRTSFRTLNKVANSLCKDMNQKEVWKHLIFYNYIQENTFDRFPGSKISDEYYTNSEKAFWEILKFYTPDIIICSGRKLYDKLPVQNGEQGPDIEIQDGEYDAETWIYKIGNKKIITIPIISPSSFSYISNNWNCIFVELFKNLQHETF